MDNKEVIAFLTGKAHAYNRVFSGPLGRKVLKDLARFCRANESTFHQDPRIHAVMEGRREVWLQIMRYTNLTPEEILALRTEDLQIRRKVSDDE